VLGELDGFVSLEVEKAVLINTSRGTPLLNGKTPLVKSGTSWRNGFNVAAVVRPRK
jgi:hypothetical protein